MRPRRQSDTGRSELSALLGQTDEGFSMRKSTQQVDLFTPAEHAVLAAWMKLPVPAEASAIDLKHALADMGFSELPGGHYTYEDAAVARILIEAAEERLPSFAVSITADGEESLSFAREYRDPDGKPPRKTSLLPRP